MQLILTHCCKFIVSLLSVTVRGSVGEWLRSRWLHLINFAGSFLNKWGSQHWQCFTKTLLPVPMSAAALKMGCTSLLVSRLVLPGLAIACFSVPSAVAQVSLSLADVSWGWGAEYKPGGWEEVRIYSYIRRMFFTMMAVKHWNRLPRRVVGSPSLEIFEARL